MKLFRTTDDTTTDDTTSDDETSREENGDTAMSQEPTAPDDDEQPAYAGLGSESEPAEPAAGYRGADTAAGQPRPSFTPAATATENDAPVTSMQTGAADDGGELARPMPAATTAQHDTPTMDEPLLADTAAMRASWQKVQAEFVDDPRAAVMDAADLIEATAQSLVDALEQRQRRLRDTVTSDSAGSGSAAASGTPDTEHLRLMMQRYRSLFDQLCRS